MIYYSCPLINIFALNINGRIDNGDKCITLCCEGIEDKPALEFKKTHQETIESFAEMHRSVINEGKRFANKKWRGKRLYTAGCVKCANYKLAEWGNEDGLIHYVNLSMYPAPCQCKCIYCGVHSSESGRFNKNECGEYYEKLFDTLDYVREKGLIAENVSWQISTGEIAIHPYKDRIFKLVEGQRAIFYTNCFKFDDKIARNLGTNPHSAINLSIDAGTPETWQKIKGFDNFEEVTQNLVKYFNASSQPGQITLKYIILPGINDNLEDYLSVVEIMKILHVKHLTIARDTSKKYELGTESKETLIGAAGYLLAVLTKNQLSADMFTYAPEEREKVIEFAKNLLNSGEI